MDKNINQPPPAPEPPPKPPPKSTEIKDRDPKWAKWDKDIKERYGKSH